MKKLKKARAPKAKKTRKKSKIKLKRIARKKKLVNNHNPSLRKKPSKKKS